MAEKHDWSKFYTQTKESPPSGLLVKALGYVPQKGKAIDIGGGALKDSRFLLKEGFDVTDIDSHEPSPETVQGLDPKRFHTVISSFADFHFPEGEYDIASAMYSLPFNPPETFENVFEGIKHSLRKEGIFCGNFFGVRDDWSAKAGMTFHTAEQAKKSLEDMETLLFEEREWDGKTANGTPKHWHTFEFIAKKV